MRSILVVEPDPELRQSDVALLENLDAEVLQTGEGHQALAMIEARRPDLILCSPEIDGNSAGELCEFVREFLPGFISFVLVVPGEADPEQERRKAKADIALARPLTANQIATVFSLLQKIGELQTRLAYLNEENEELRSDTGGKTIQDSETGFYRFDLFKQVMLKEVKRARRYDYQLALLLLAFDNYSKVAGWLSPEQRQVLFGHMRRVVVNCIRDIDIPLMFADEKVMVVMPHTDLNSAAIVADRIRDRIGEITPPPSLARLTVTVSIAVASTETEGEVSFGRLVHNAMRGLDEAVIKGGNVVIVCAKPPEGEGSEGLEPGGELGPRIYFV